MASRSRYHIFISGRVQGVFFRDSTRKKAKELAVNGWVRNLPDGRVEAVFEGEKEKVNKLIEWAERGPIIAKVDNIEIVEEKYQDDFKNFEIR